MVYWCVWMFKRERERGERKEKTDSCQEEEEAHGWGPPDFFLWAKRCIEIGDFGDLGGTLPASIG